MKPLSSTSRHLAKPKAGVRRRSSAFSLVELLVSMAILSTLMVILFSFFDQATKAWQSSEKKIDAFREARAAFFYLKRDLQGMVVDSNIPWFYYDDPTTAGIQSNTSPNAYGDSLFFISTQASGAQEAGKDTSSLCAVGYYLAYTPDPGHMGGGRSSYKLYRYFRSSDDAWNDTANNKGLFPFLQSVTASTPNTNLLLPPIINDEVIARYIINFFVTPLDTSLNAITTAGANNTKPAFVNISLTAFSYATAQKLANQSAWHNPPGNLGNNDPQVFHIRIPVL